MKRLTLLLILSLGLAACAGSSDSSTDELMTPDRSSVGADDQGGEAGPDTAASKEIAVNFDLIDDRKVIRRASLTLHASDTRAAYEEIVRMTESIGGFVSNAEVFPSDDEGQPQVSITVRLPAEQLNATMTAIKDSVDEVVTESQGAQDVTEQFVDLEARLINLEALEVELRALLAEVRQQPEADPEKILTVFNELASVRGQIEQIQGQINYLSDLTALATLDVYVTQTPSAVPIVENPWAPADVAKDALRGLVTSLQAIADWAISFAISTLPVLLIALGIPLTVGYYLYRRIRGIGDRGGPAAPSPAES